MHWWVHIHVALIVWRFDFDHRWPICHFVRVSQKGLQGDVSFHPIWNKIPTVHIIVLLGFLKVLGLPLVIELNAVPHVCPWILLLEIKLRVIEVTRQFWLLLGLLGAIFLLKWLLWRVHTSHEFWEVFLCDFVLLWRIFLSWYLLLLSGDRPNYELFKSIELGLVKASEARRSHPYRVVFFGVSIHRIIVVFREVLFNA